MASQVYFEQISVKNKTCYGSSIVLYIYVIVLLLARARPLLFMYAVLQINKRRFRKKRKLKRII